MTSTSPTRHSCYDILILGGGTAGCVLASRLSAQDPLRTDRSPPRVFLLEAGNSRNDDPRVRIPGLMMHNFHDPAIDWDYLTIPQKGLDNKQLRLARGKGLGGSSLINYMALVHPGKAEIDAWGEINDDTGWRWEGLLPYLQKFHTWREPSQNVVELLGLDRYIDRSAQGVSGPIQASYQDEEHMEIDKAWLSKFRIWVTKWCWTR